MNAPNDFKAVLIALGLHFVAVAGIVLCRTYVDLLFLSEYPRHWLPYLFMGQTIMTVVLTFGITPLFNRGPRISGLVLLFFAVLILVVRFALGFGLPGLPFAFCLFLGGLSILLGVISWSAVADAFDVRDFRKVASWVNSSGSVGALLAGSLVPFVVSTFSAESLLYVLAAAVLGTGVAVMLLDNNESREASVSTASRSPLSYPLFRNLAFGVLLLMVIDTIADYSLKSELAAAFSKEEIGAFMGPFYGISSALTLVLQFFATKPLVSHFGILGLLGTVPLFCFAGYTGIALLPGLWTATALRLGQGVFYYSTYGVGREIVTRPLPGAVRRLGKVYLKGLVTPIGSGIAALFLWLLADRLELRGLAICALPICLAWLLVLTRTTKWYQHTLQEAVRIRRFRMEDHDFDDAALIAGRSVAEEMLASDAAPTVLCGLELFEEMGGESLPSAALKHLDSEDAEVRMAVARAIRRIHDRSGGSRLVERLGLEQDPEVVWRLLEALAVVAAEQAVDHARELIKNEDALIRGGAILVLLEAGDLDQIIEAASALRLMVAHPESAMRLAAARAIGALRAGKLEGELGTLLDDSDPEVIITAIRAAGERGALGLASAISLHLGAGKASYYAVMALSRMGESAVSAVLSRLRASQRPAVINAAIRALVVIDAPIAEASLIGLIDGSDVAIRTTLARELALRARRVPVSERLRSVATKQVDEAAEAVRALGAAADTPNLKPALATELEARRRLAIDRLLHWLALATEPTKVLDVIPAILDLGTAPKVKARRATAIELLDSLAGDGSQRAALATIEARPKTQSQIGLAQLQNLKDPWILWLIRAIESKGEPKMELAQHVLLLRQVDIFRTLSGDVLMTIAEMCEAREVLKGQRIFASGDAPDGLYVVASGNVRIKNAKEVLADLKEADFFGEVAVLDNSLRMADAVAASDSLLLFLDREAFNRITEDLPEVLRGVIRTLIGYLKNPTSPTRNRQASGWFAPTVIGQ